MFSGGIDIVGSRDRRGSMQSVPSLEHTMRNSIGYGYHLYYMHGSRKQRCRCNGVRVDLGVAWGGGKRGGLNSRCFGPGMGRLVARAEPADLRQDGLAVQEHAPRLPGAHDRPSRLGHPAGIEAGPKRIGRGAGLDPLGPRAECPWPAASAARVCVCRDSGICASPAGLSGGSLQLAWRWWTRS